MQYATERRQYSFDRYHLQVEFDLKECQVSPEDLTRMHNDLAPLGEAVEDFPNSQLWITLIRHPRPGASAYHVEAKLKLPGQTLFSGDWDESLDVAFQRCVRKLIRKVGAYREHPDQKA